MTVYEQRTYADTFKIFDLLEQINMVEFGIQRS